MEQLEGLPQHLLVGRGRRVARLKHFLEVLDAQIEGLAELVAGPLNTMQSLFREHLERAMRYFTLLRRVILRAISLCLERDYDLDMALGPESAGLEQGLAADDAALVDIEAGLHVVESVGDQGLAGKELVREDGLGGVAHPVQPGHNVPLEEGVHLDGCGCCG